MTCCLLCGTQWNVEWRPTDQVQSQVSERYKEGPFAWKNLQEATEPESPFCTHCLNHIRKRRRLKKKEMLPVDQYLLGLMSPGLMSKVDMRSLKRLRRVMGQVSNPFRYLGICPLQTILESKTPVRTWWSINLCTSYFNDRVTARIVRQEIKVPAPMHAR